MYDTIAFQMPGVMPERVGALFDATTAKEVVQIQSGAVSYEGRIRGLFVRCSESMGVRVNGSVAKFASGGNTVALQLGEFREAVQELETLFGCSLARARVSRMDCGVTVAVRGECKQYVSIMAGLDGFERREIGVGALHYWQKSKELAIYDKAAELRERGEQVPERFVVGGALRVELRQRRRLTEQYGGVVTLGRLQGKGFWNSQLERIEKTVTAIHILEKRGGSMQTREKLMALLYRCTVQQLGEDVFLAGLYESWKAGGMSESTYKRERRKVRMAAQSGMGEQGEEFRGAIRAELERLRA